MTRGEAEWYYRSPRGNVDLLVANPVVRAKRAQPQWLQWLRERNKNRFFTIEN